MTFLKFLFYKSTRFDNEMNEVDTNYHRVRTPKIINKLYVIDIIILCTLGITSLFVYGQVK